MVRWLDEEEARRSGGLKWAAVRADTLAAWVAEMDVATPPFVHDALVEGLRRHATTYPPQEAMTDLPERIAAWHRRRLGQPVEATRILFAGDVIAGIQAALRALVPAGSDVVVTTPVYFPFFFAIDAEGMHQRRVPLRVEAGRHALDLDGIDAAFAAGARAMILCNPHNPTGSAPTRDELVAVADLAERHDALVISDEVHAPLALPGADVTPFSVAAPDAAERTVTITSTSKAFNLPGLRFAWIVPGSERLHRHVAARPFFTRGAWAMPGHLATAAAVTHGDAWLDDLVADLADRHALVRGALSGVVPDTAVARPDASFLAWIDLAETSIADRPVAALADAGVRVSPGVDFGQEGRQHVRINVAAATSTLHRVMERVATAIGGDGEGVA